MKTIPKILSPILLLLFFSLILANANAQNGNDSPNAHQKVLKQNPSQPSEPVPPGSPAPPPPPPPPPPPDMDPMEDAPAGLDIPGLTEDQKAGIRTLRLKQMQAMTPYRNQIREKKARLTTILTTPPVDMNAAEAIADELGKIDASVLKLMIRHDQALRDLLTPDQQVVFDTHPKPFLRKMKPQR